VQEPGTGESGSPGIVQSLRNLAATLVAILRTRFELFVAELEEERIRILQTLFWAAGALFFFGVGILLIVVLLVALFWDSHRILSVLVLAGIFFAGGTAMAIAVRNRLRVRPRLFAASLDELAKDKDRLTSQ
jgi:uncharacterized membrane protein YqjE